jgi:DNA-directed RNA polymerase
MTPNQDKIHLSKNKIDVIQVRTTHLGKVTLGIGEGKRPDYKAMEKALAPSFVHSYDAAVLKSSFQDWHQPIALIHDCLKVLPNDMDKAKERIKHGFVQVCKGDPLARLADEMEVSSEQLPRLTQGPGDLSAVLDSSSYMFN